MSFLGLIFALPAIVIPALTGILNEHNSNEFLTVTAVQASWIGKILKLQKKKMGKSLCNMNSIFRFIGSIGYLIQPVGCLIGTMSGQSFWASYLPDISINC